MNQFLRVLTANRTLLPEAGPGDSAWTNPPSFRDRLYAFREFKSLREDFYQVGVESAKAWDSPAVKEAVDTLVEIWDSAHSATDSLAGRSIEDVYNSVNDRDRSFLERASPNGVMGLSDPYRNDIEKAVAILNQAISDVRSERDMR